MFFIAAASCLIRKTNGLAGAARVQRAGHQGTASGTGHPLPTYITHTLACSWYQSPPVANWLSPPKYFVDPDVAFLIFFSPPTKLSTFALLRFQLSSTHNPYYRFSYLVTIWAGSGQTLSRWQRSLLLLATPNSKLAWLLLFVYHDQRQHFPMQQSF